MEEHESIFRVSIFSYPKNMLIFNVQFIIAKGYRLNSSNIIKNKLLEKFRSGIMTSIFTMTTRVILNLYFLHFLENGDDGKQIVILHYSV